MGEIKISGTHYAVIKRRNVIGIFENKLARNTARKRADKLGERIYGRAVRPSGPCMGLHVGAQRVSAKRNMNKE